MTDPTVLERFRAGDAEAVRSVYRDHGRAVFAVALSALGDRSLAEEVTQQTFLKAWRAADQLDTQREVAPWLYTIARRTAIDVWRREALRTAQSYDDPDSSLTTHPALSTPAPSFEGAWDAHQVRLAVEGLDDDERAVVRLAHFEGLSHAEIATRLDLPLGTVKSRSHRAHRRLAARLAYLVEDSS